MMPKFTDELNRKLELARKSLRILSLGIAVKRRIWTEVAELAADQENETIFNEACTILELL